MQESGVDEVVYNITKALKHDLYYNSVIVFASDLGSHGYYIINLVIIYIIIIINLNNYPLRGAKSTLYEGESRVPGFIHSPLLKKTNYTYSGRSSATSNPKWLPKILPTTRFQQHKPRRLGGFVEAEVDLWQVENYLRRVQAPKVGVRAEILPGNGVPHETTPWGTPTPDLDLHEFVWICVDLSGFSHIKK
uniref:Sulfatase N-terminal domain-containing protein n=1 Tax=Strigamia maritima TaxID=126957 RepID=T1J5M0_STRMM